MAVHPHRFETLVTTIQVCFRKVKLAIWNVIDYSLNFILWDSDCSFPLFRRTLSPIYISNESSSSVEGEDPPAGCNEFVPSGGEMLVAVPSGGAMLVAGPSGGEILVAGSS